MGRHKTGLLATLLFILIALPFAVFAANSENPAALPLSPPAIFKPTPQEALSLELLNEARAVAGLKPLVLDDVLTRVARAHSADMAARNYFGHIEPDAFRRTPMVRYAEALGRPPQVMVGENIARCTQPLTTLIHIELLQSPEHSELILSNTFARAGIGFYTDADGHTWVTQMFCGQPPKKR